MYVSNILGALNFFFFCSLVGMSGVEYRNGGLKNFFFFFACGSRSKELKNFNVLRAYELKFGPNLDNRTENFYKFLSNSSHRSQRGF